MFEYKAPTFAPGPLRQEILYAMRDLPLLEQAARYEAYSDGIIYGCDLYESNMDIGISGGLIKYGGRVYVQSEKDSVHYEPTEEWTVLKIRFYETTNRDFKSYRGELALDTNLRVLPNEMEMGRFKLKQGSRLRTEYTDFYDMDTEYDTVNLLFIQQAGRGESTLHSEITRRFAMEAYPHTEQPEDLFFCASCLSSQLPVERSYIQNYICRKISREYHEMPNDVIFEHLKEILRQIKREKRGFGAGDMDSAGLIMM